jgi:outer membrane murein-binding lipoprotein Lpp
MKKMNDAKQNLEQAAVKSQELESKYADVMELWRDQTVQIKDLVSSKLLLEQELHKARLAYENELEERHANSTSSTTTSLQERIFELENELRDLRLSNEMEANSNIQSLNNEIMELRDSMRIIMEGKSKVNTETDEKYKAKHAELSTKIRNLEIDIEALSEENEVTRCEVDILNGRIDELEESKEKLRIENDRLSKELQNTINVLDEKKDEDEMKLSKTREIDMLKEQIGSMQEKEKTKLEEWGKTTEEYNRVVSILQKRCLDLESGMKQLISNAEIQTTRIATLQAEIDSLNSKDENGRYQAALLKVKEKYGRKLEKFTNDFAEERKRLESRLEVL